VNSHSDKPTLMDGCATRVVDAERVRTVRSRMPADSELDDTADVFGLMADPGRLRLLVALLDGELCVCDLAAVSGLSESATSHALRLLRAHRVVAVRRAGRMAYYRLDDAHVRLLLDLAVAHTEHTEAIHPERGGDR
jgi:DNA-binding transcriptional ArsR family regulator